MDSQANFPQIISLPTEDRLAILAKLLLEIALEEEENGESNE